MKMLFEFAKNCLLTLIFFGLSVFTVFGKGKEHPNILIIVVDDLGWGDLSVNGGKDINTPHIDKLFEEGLTFTNFYSNSTVCSPTRASLLTGCYPDLVGVPGVIRANENNSWGYFSPHELTLPGILKKEGYHTALIGKWHLGLNEQNLPNEHDFDFFKGWLSGMMDDYETHLQSNVNYLRMNKQEISAKGHATDLFTDWSIDYLSSERQNSQPFLLILSYTAPHYPIQPPKEWYRKVLNREKNIDSLRAKNVAFVEHLDAGIGKVMNTLKSTGLSKNTLVVFTSDNGGHLPSFASNGNLRGGKGDMYEGGIKVPACMVWPGKIEAGSKSTELGLTMDLYPTLCQITDITFDHAIDGVSLWPVFSNRQSEDEDRVVFWVRREGGQYGGLSYYAARKGPLKLVQNSPWEPVQLFNLENDPLEQTPLNINSPESRELRNQLIIHINKSGSIPWRKP